MKISAAILLALVLGQIVSDASLAATGVTKPTFTVRSYVQKKGTLKSVLHLIARDSEDHAGLCDYLVEDLHYTPASRTLSVQLQREPCFNDGYGKSSGDIYWRLPHGLENERGELTVVINGDTEVKLAFDPASGNFEIENEEAR